MTSFDIYESSAESSRPIEIYSITIGADTYRYTSHSSDVTVGVLVYESIPISRGSIGQGSEERRRLVSVRMPSSNAFAQLFVNIVPGQNAVVNIIRLQRDESPTFNTQALTFKGLVASAQFVDDGDTLELQLRSIEAAASRSVPRFTFMGLCNHILYSDGCGANPASFTVVGEVTAVNGNVITVTGANSQADGYWRGGYCKPSAKSDFRLILAHTGNDLTLLLPFKEDVLGQNVQAFAGCDHVISGDCATKFDRVIEHGGFAFVPTKNPFATGLD